MIPFTEYLSSFYASIYGGLLIGLLFDINRSLKSNFKILKSCIKNKIQNKYDKIKVPKNAVHLFINYHILYYIFLTNHSTKAFASPFSNEFILNICELGFLNNV